MRKVPSRRHGRRSLVVALTLLMALGIAIPVYALGASTFDAEDGNLVVDGITETDWANAPNRAFGDDKPTGQGDDSFGNGTKEDTPVPSVIDGSIPNNKSDLTRFYVANENVAGGNFLYLAWERVQDPSGTTNMDFEFNQSSVISANGITPVRTAGDVLLKYDLSQGGTNPTFGIHRWLTQGSAANCEASAKLPCWGKLKPLGAEAAGSVNTGTVTDPIRGVSLSPRTFGEAAIDLTAAGILDPTKCQSFGKAYLKSRSSDSFTAAVKDFIAPIDVDINNCKADTIELRKVDDQGAPLAGALLQLFRDDNGVPGLQGAATGGTPADTKIGECTTALPGATCAFGDILTAGTYIGHEAQAPNGYAGAADQSVDVTVDNVADVIELSFTNTPVPGTISIHKQDDAATPNALAGAEFKLVRDNAPTAAGGQTAPGAEDTDTGRTCTTGADGNCSFANVALGDYWVVETKAPAGHFLADPQPATIELGGAPGQGDTVELGFTDPRAHKVIVITCHEGTNTLTPSSVTVDGQTKGSLTGAPAGLTEAQLCGLGGASFGGKPHGQLAAGIDIAGH